jgi:Uma2 family endonuclease
MTTQLLEPKKSQAQDSRSTERNGHARLAEIVINGNVHIPSWVIDHDSFRRWAFSEAFPERGRFAWLDGRLWVDLSMETDFHSQIKTVITIVLGSIVLNEALGRFYADGMLISNKAIGLSCEPDAMFVSNSRLEKGQAQLQMGDKSLEINGSVDMALEVISKSSIDKDLGNAMQLYAKAAISEYWLVDSTIDSPELVIMRLRSGKYVAARKHGGWVRSHVFGRSFCLTCQKDANGLSQFNLETK